MLKTYKTNIVCRTARRGVAEKATAVSRMSTWRARKEERLAEAEKSSSLLGISGADAGGAGVTKKSKNERRGGRNKKKVATQRKGNASLRGKIRGLERTLAHQGDSMTPAARKAKEEEIVSLKALFEDRRRRERERTLAKKYHMVKFFERRKIQRRLDKIGELSKKPDADLEALGERRKSLQADLGYVTNFPRDKPYVALFPSEGHTEESLAAVEKVRGEILAGDFGDGSEDGSARMGAASSGADDEVNKAGDSDAVDDHDDFFLHGDD